MTDENNTEDKKDWYDKMSTVETVFALIVFFVISFIVGYGMMSVIMLIYYNIRKTNEVNKIKKDVNFVACPKLKQFDNKTLLANPDKTEICSCYLTKDTNHIHGCTDSNNIMFRNLY